MYVCVQFTSAALHTLVLYSTRKLLCEYISVQCSTVLVYSIMYETMSTAFRHINSELYFDRDKVQVSYSRANTSIHLMEHQTTSSKCIRTCTRSEENGFILCLLIKSNDGVISDKQSPRH